MAALAGAILILITAAICYTIGMRYLFTKTTIWIIPMCEYALLWIVFLATAWLLGEKGHITTDIVYSHLGERVKVYLDGVMSAIGGFACGFMAFFGIAYVIECITKGVTDVRAVTVPKWAIFIVIPIGSLLLTLQFFRMAWSRWAELRKER